MGPTRSLRSRPADARQGSGVIVDAKQGYVVTNFHVVQDAAALEVKLAEGRTITDVRLVGYDVLMDLAVLKPTRRTSPPPSGGQ